jgi:lipopolysaccharide export system protein LptC
MTSGGSSGPVRALPRQPADLAAIWPEPDRVAGRWRPLLAADRYSRLVAVLKRVLPAIGLILLLLVAVWPRLGTLLESVRLAFPAIDLREARELRMVGPRYAGIDRLNRPYLVTAAIGRQVPNRDDLMSLEQPRAQMTVHAGASIVVTAATGVYQSQAQLLDLFDDVNLIHENGTRFKTQSAHVDVSSNNAEGHDPVDGHGPSGDITAQGFRILDKGDTIIFTGRSNLLLKGTKPSANPAMPPALPAEVVETAAQIEAAATASPAVPSEPPPPSNVAAEPGQTEPAAKPHASPKPSAAVRRDAKPPLGGARAKRDAGLTRSSAE